MSHAPPRRRAVRPLPAFALPAAALFACDPPDAAPAAPPAPAPAADGGVPIAALGARVGTEQAAAAARVPVVVVPAEVVPLPDGVHRVGPGVDARLLAWHVAPGDRVSAGQRLATLRATDLTERQGRVRALAAVAAQRSTLARLAAEAAAAGVGTAAEAAAAEAARAEAEAEWQAAQEGLRAAGAGADAADGDWAWTAPADGQVGALRCAPGPVEAGAVCAELVVTGAAAVEARVPERVLHHLGAGAAGAPVGAWVGADGAPAVLPLLAREPRLDPQTRQQTFRFAAPDGALLGASGRLTVEVPAGPEHATVPAAALTRLGGEAVVFVVADGVARPQPVKDLGPDGAQRVVAGLAPGAVVASRGVFLLKSLAAAAEGGGEGEEGE
jgi:cobalt-zinc-cadmium efflux system membrane fusion protein